MRAEWYEDENGAVHPIRDERGHWTQDFLDTLLRELERGTSYRATARKFGVADGNIALRFPGYGQAGRTKPQFHLTPAQRDTAEALLEQGESINSVSTMLLIPRPVLRHNFPGYVLSPSEAATIAGAHRIEQHRKLLRYAGS